MSEITKIKFEEFKSAFKDARFRAISHFLDDPDYDEKNSLARLQLLPKLKQELLLKNVYERCFHLGLEISQRYKKIGVKDEFIHLLSYTGIPCVTGNWQTSGNETPFALTQKRCPDVHGMTDYSPNKIKCSYWNEALKGIAAGINPEILFSSTKVLNNGKDTCVNYIFDQPFSGEIWQNLPAKLHEFLLKLKKIYAFFGINFILVFYSDGNVFYRLEKDKHFSSWIDYKNIINLFQKTYLLNMPNINLFEQ